MRREQPLKLIFGCVEIEIANENIHDGVS
jgi:hypothetical protein